MTPGNIVMQRTAIAQRDSGQRALGGFRRLADGFRHFARLAMAETDPALLIANNDECRETEALAALDHLGHTIDVDQLVSELAVALFAATWATTRTVSSGFLCHIQCSLRIILSENRFPLSG